MSLLRCHSCWRALATLALGALAVACSTAGIADATFLGTASHATTAATLVLLAPTDVTTSTSDRCATIEVSWAAPRRASGFRVLASVDGGPFTELVADTGAVARYVDRSDRTGHAVTYRVVARAGTSWTGPPADAAPAACP